VKNNDLIQEIELEVASRIIDTRKPLGYFYSPVAGLYIGIDNSTGYAWTEEFDDLRQCRRWLVNPCLLHPSMED